MSAVVWMAFQNGESAIKLFQQHYARQFMRQCDLAKRENMVRGGAGRFAPAIGWAYGEQQFLRVMRLVVLEEVRDLSEVSCRPARVESTSTGVVRVVPFSTSLSNAVFRHQFQRVAGGVA